MICYESYFLLTIVFTFFVEYEVVGQLVPVRDLKKIAENYMKGHFLLDLIPVIPLQLLEVSEQARAIFYIIKFIRIFIGIEFLSPGAIAEYITDYNIDVRIKNMIEKDNEAAESQD